MRWRFVDARREFQLHRDHWDRINRSQGDHILLDSTFVDALVRHFAPSGTLLAISEDPANPGAALVVKTKKGLWQTFQPSQQPLGLILLGSAQGAVDQTRALMRALPGCALRLSVCQQDPDHTVFANLQPRRDVEVLDYINTARVAVAGSFDEYWRNRGRDLSDNLARRYRKLAKDGVKCELVVAVDPGRVAEGVQEYARLESSGWKGKEGTAVAAENSQGLFYREILESFCSRGEGVIYQLQFNGKTVASQLGLVREGVLILLKTAYDESVSTYSPGFLLQHQLFKSVFEGGAVRDIEFYGRVREGWTLKWTDQVRTMYHVNLYRYAWLASARQFAKSGLEWVRHVRSPKNLDAR